MPKNNKNKNAFFFFLLDWKKEAEARGRTFPNGLLDAQRDPECSFEWRNLSSQRKGIYEAIAKNNKVTGEKKADKKTNLGESIRAIEERSQKEKMYVQTMNRVIKTAISMGIHQNVLPTMKFCFIHVNWFFERPLENGCQYFPAEYSVAIFSLQNGIEDVYHEIVGAPIPLGYKREALETSRDTHNIPVQHSGAETNFATMYKKLVSFLEMSKIAHKFPPLYTTRALLAPVNSLLKMLSDAANKDVADFKVYELETLYIHISNETFKTSDRKLSDIPIYAESVFTRVTYSFEKGYECNFHKYVDGGCEYCSMSVLKQWSFILCEEFCKNLMVNMKPDIHYPRKMFYEDGNTVNLISKGINNLNIEHSSFEHLNEYPILSMTGVSEQYRTKASERTCTEEKLRRERSKPVNIIDYSKLNESVYDNAAQLSSEVEDLYLDEEPTNVSKYKTSLFNLSYNAVATATVEDYIPENGENFPAIGGRGVLCKPLQAKTTKLGLGRGKGDIRNCNF